MVSVVASFDDSESWDSIKRLESENLERKEAVDSVAEEEDDDLLRAW